MDQEGSLGGLISGEKKGLSIEKQANRKSPEKSRVKTVSVYITEE
jgi:hypothetical protein